MFWAILARLSMKYFGNEKSIMGNSVYMKNYMTFEDGLCPYNITRHRFAPTNNLQCLVQWIQLYWLTMPFVDLAHWLHVDYWQFLPAQVNNVM